MGNKNKKHAQKTINSGAKMNDVVLRFQGGTAEFGGYGKTGDAKIDAFLAAMTMNETTASLQYAPDKDPEFQNIRSVLGNSGIGIA